MSQGRWERLKELFSEAAERSGPEREAFVEGLTGEDALLRGTLLSLLRSDQADSFLEEPAVRFGEAGNAVVPERLGAYAILREIGRGGMGAVYLAARADAEFEKEVAIKIVRGGLGGRLLRERFRQERQILARLDHPNIARLLDGGTTPEGVPWVAMEYVDGNPVTEHCEKGCLGLGARLALFRTICSAVHFAHQNLVVHRDLKPGNILVTGDGVPKLLDFGIAKLLEEGDEGSRAQAVTALRAMTPDYASPEQVRGEPVTILSDVYSLGIVLFELLAGQRPYRTTGAFVTEVEKVHQAGPPLPSSVRSVPRDLDAIVAKAMRKEPSERYASVALLSEDVGRFLDGAPVEARRGSAGYRARRFVARHKAAVGAALLVVLSLVGGIIVSARQARIARQERAKAEKRLSDLHRLSNTLLFDIYGNIENLAGALPAREALVKKALEYLGALAKESTGDASLTRDLASAYQKVGEIQGQPYHANLGDISGSLTSLRTALEMRERLLRSDPVNAALERERNAGLDQIGSILAWNGGVTEGLATLRRTQESRRRLAVRFPKDRRIQRELAISALKIGDLFASIGDRPAAIASETAALSILDALAREKPDDRRAFRDVVMARNELATLHGDDGDLVKAIAALEASVTELKAWLRRQPHDGDLQRDLAIALNKIGVCRLDAGEPWPAVAATREALAIVESLLAADPKDTRGRKDVAYTRTRLGIGLAAAGDSSGAEASFAGAVAEVEVFLAASPRELYARGELVHALSEWGELLGRRGDRTLARANLDRALSVAEALVAEDPKTVYYRELRETTMKRIAGLGKVGGPTPR